nr:DUF6879 family protein [Streptomyces prunicolor]
MRTPTASEDRRSTSGSSATSRALVLHFDDADEYLGAGLVEDPARIAEFIRIRDAAWPHAIRRRDFAAQVASSG